MTQIYFENNLGKSILIDKSDPYLLQSIGGLGDVPASTQTQEAPYQDGSTYIDSILESRPIPISFTILAYSPQDLADKKRYISELFNPKRGLGLLSYEFYGGVYEIEVVSENVPEFPSGSDNRGVTYQRVLLNLLAPDPYWKEPQEVSRSLKAFEGKFSFPFAFPVQFGIEGDITTLENDGDTSTPVIIVIQGPINRPMIENRTTGQFIRINTYIDTDQVLYIDTSERNRRVEIHTDQSIRKIMGYFDHQGDFWKLESGENAIRYKADEGLATAIAAISWKNQFTGI